jgi:flap endonuclease-1
LTKLLAEHAPRASVLRRVEDYRGRVIAIDASLSIYQFLVSHLPSISFPLRLEWCEL